VVRIKIINFFENSMGSMKINWKHIGVIVAVSMVLASVFSGLVGHLFYKQTVKKIQYVYRRLDKIDLLSPSNVFGREGLDVVYERNLFNFDIPGDEVDLEKPTAFEDLSKLRKSTLPIKLVGLIYSGDPVNGVAVIQVKSSVSTFFVNDLIMEDAVLSQVLEKKIIISQKNGQREYLELKKKELHKNRRGKRSSKKSSLKDLSLIYGDIPPKSFEEEGFKRKGRFIQMSESYRSRLLTTDFTKMLQDAKATPNIVDGALQGFLLENIKKFSVYWKAGLMPGDVVEEINGEYLSDTGQSIKLVQSLRSAKEVDVRVKREGKYLDFQIRF